MKREIKFRAWDEQNKVMHYNFQFIKSGEEGNDWIIFTSDKQTLKDQHHPFENPYLQQQLKIMQFTGCVDKNGKELYEGDRICAEDDHSHNNWTWEIVFEDGEFSAKHKYDQIGLHYWDPIEIELIDNVFEPKQDE